MSNQPKEPETKAPNDIRVRVYSRVPNIIRYCNSLLKEKNMTSLNFSAVGGAINKLVSAVEVLKIVNAGLYQSNKLATVSYQAVDSNQQVENKRLYPKMTITLSTKPLDKNEGFQDKYTEEEREKLYKIFNETFNTRRPGLRRRGRFGRRPIRGRGFRRGPRRGGRPTRGGFRARRGGFRGRGLPRRGGFRGGRGVVRAIRGRGFRRNN